MLVLLTGSLSGLQAQNNVIVSGKVTLENNEPAPGVSVLVKGTSSGTSTQADGTYAVAVPGGNAILVFSFIGYAGQEITVGNRTTLHVKLSPDAKALEEVLIIGYGEQSRATLTTAISKLGEEEFRQAPAANPLLQLQGKVAGVSIQASNGQPGANPQIFVRGGTSTSPEGDTPLLIVDGVVGVMRNISDLNPDDIESIQVLKDAASTAIYGVAAANGVIIVKTKSGKTGKPAITFKYTHGIDQQARQYDFLNARDYIQVSRNNIFNYNTDPAIRERFLSGALTACRPVTPAIPEIPWHFWIPTFKTTAPVMWRA